MTVSAWTTNPYPLPRKNRKGSGSGQQTYVEEAAVYPSRTYLWTFEISEASGPSRGTVGSRRVTGPALLKRLNIELLQPADGGDPAPVFQLFWSTSPITDAVDQATAVPSGMNNIFETNFKRNDALVLPPRSAGFMGAVNATVLTRYDLLLDTLITQPEFYLGASVIAEKQVGGSDAVGHLTVYEGVDLVTVQMLMG